MWEKEQTYSEIIGDKSNLFFVQLLTNTQGEERGNVVNEKNGNFDENTKSEISAKKIIPFTIIYKTNFIENGDKVVLDRSYEETNKYNSLLLLRNQDQNRKINAVAKWDFTNPNILSIETSASNVRNISFFLFSLSPFFYFSSLSFFHLFFPFSSQKIGIRVSKRAVENSLPPDTLGYSEYSQILESDPRSAVPKVIYFSFLFYGEFCFVLFCVVLFYLFRCMINYVVCFLFFTFSAILS